MKLISNVNKREQMLFLTLDNMRIAINDNIREYLRC